MDNLKNLESMHLIVKEFRTLGKLNREILLTMLTKEHDVLGTKVDDPFDQIKKEYINGGRREKIPAIKAVRDVARDSYAHSMYYGLKEAKDLVESW